MTIKKYKCDECGEEIGMPDPVKGQNNTYLCGRNWMKGSGKCGNNVCFICGKIETGTEWVRGYDCQGNNKMVEQKKSLFSQNERDENDPNRKLCVKYCDEHKEEAQKSPLKWTDADDKRIEEEKREIEEKLNSQRGLFYCYDPFPRSVEWKSAESKYECVYFWGKENNQNFFLMVPDTHPVLKDLKYTEKVKSDFDGREVECTRYNLEKQFYTIEGVDNLPLETSDNKYKGDDPYEKAYKFNKFVGLSDKIKLIPVNSQGQPEKNKPSNNQNENKNNKISFTVPNSVKEYFQKNDVKSIKMETNSAGPKSFMVEYNDDEKNNKPLIVLALNNPIFQELEDYFSKTNKNFLTRQELDLDTNSDTTPTTKPKNNALWIGCGIVGGGAIIAVIIGFLLPKKKKKKNELKKVNYFSQH